MWTAFQTSGNHFSLNIIVVCGVQVTDQRKDSKPGKSESWKRKEGVTHLKRKRMTKRQHITVQKSPFEAPYRFIWKYINISHAHHIIAPSTLQYPVPAGIHSASGVLSGAHGGNWPYVGLSLLSPTISGSCRTLDKSPNFSAPPLSPLWSSKTYSEDCSYEFMK